MNEQSQELLYDIETHLQNSPVDMYRFANGTLKDCLREICSHMSRMEGEIDQLKVETNKLKGS